MGWVTYLGERVGQATSVGCFGPRDCARGVSRDTIPSIGVSSVRPGLKLTPRRSWLKPQASEIAGLRTAGESCRVSIQSSLQNQFDQAVKEPDRTTKASTMQAEDTTCQFAFPCAYCELLRTWQTRRQPRQTKSLAGVELENETTVRGEAARSRRYLVIRKLSCW